ncbi:hypothetical protein [Helicobacter canis]|uniref:hypothetical protein n=1 Tax=Helicobacter canis TaxID=29419 RepID=UPI0026F33E62|nr:hypothetical protein [Helicobacter canis]
MDCSTALLMTAPFLCHCEPVAKPPTKQSIKTKHKKWILVKLVKPILLTQEFMDCHATASAVSRNDDKTPLVKKWILAL